GGAVTSTFTGTSSANRYELKRKRIKKIFFFISYTCMHLLIFLFLFLSLFSAEIEIGGKPVSVEIADTHESRAKGLMGRLELEDVHGMLFIYESSQKLCFWMKNTLIPLSIGFFDEEKKLIQIVDMDPPTSEPFPY